MTPTDRHALQARATRLTRAREALADLPMVEGRALVEAAAEEAQARHDVEVYAHADVLALLAALEGAEAVAAAAGAYIEARDAFDWQGIPGPAAALEAMRVAVERWEGGEK